MFRAARPASCLLLAGMLSACSMFGGHKSAAHVNAMAPSRTMTIGVNAYLWRATLDTLSFMPLAQVDSNGGVVVTEWYVNPAIPSERMKLTVSILDQDLRADAVRVSGARQVLQGGQWLDQPVQAATVQKLEDIILGKARDLRRSAVSG